MALLAIDTATPTLALAVSDDDGHVLAAFASRIPKMHATYAHPLMDEMLAVLSLEPQDIRGVIVGVGPGSYTGVRIGVTFAKVFAYALDIPIIGESSLAAAAFALRTHCGVVAVMWDARRKSVYSAVYRVQYGTFQEVLAEGKREIAAFMTSLAQVVQKDEAIYLVGDVAKAIYEQYASTFLLHPLIVADETASVYAEHLLALGYPELCTKMQSREVGDHGKDAHVLVPRYLQLAEAEARWLEKRRGSTGNESE
ncbi:tRNA (adenosine(37)-N6)-threonylcarbamoyltransferase complex dimerization subunit type 1 TsaB [Sulfoacidibacillus thermotolerans]|uniref:tRNA (Adenosine(37)-N6)-threonylcarbamoyltransferase complex dimerization subunit type 1 TsaB n=2 Tax=Sulfoacidibacillus thermotolerans TaxID=1765684 RepID=A0A2U3D5V1_SULT2|nr:tRNA (adenosine(37)-N6)-threonylcarbamoyltransferase complex dimerization subunit type 1 TsaB [Sulfoacidibacillus thermotolerans]